MMRDEAQFERWQTMAGLPAGDPERREVEKLLPSLPAPQREALAATMKDADRLRAELMRVQPPIGFEMGLLTIGLKNAAAAVHPWWRPTFSGSFGLKQAAAILLIVGTLTYLWWPSGDLPRARPLSEQKVRQIADWALENQTVPVDVNSSAPMTVLAALSDKHLPFNVDLPQPQEKLQLVGGGVCQFGSASVAFTRWQSSKDTFTLYQFDGKQAGVSNWFMPTTQCAEPGSKENRPHTVTLWPDLERNCTWALVTEKQEDAEAFGDVGCQ
jgi:hypothetical protein